MPARVDPGRRSNYWEYRRAGYSMTEAARKAGVSRDWASTTENKIRRRPRGTHEPCPVCGSVT